ncbi:TIR domain-containing protein [Amycolatopsis sp. WQ 127309]|uniref:TIR domain-containing protein n=1 Tax=Amycolatopsis sp. WQ 127309 TaxID=2932773 RepID=UPI001FF60B6A|nr:TIR domain-containing protein [Amycolatopsis sp. WQ 127309]UOZ11350.1 TIR domain-containing protein [Amycolatopsis sp. WQ 127309]
MPDYEYDIFLSYRRSGAGLAGEWVRNHFHPLLRDCLADELATPPRIFLDVEQETGTYWPARLERALRHSRLLVAVWSPPYFQSPWCLAELTTMSAREQVAGRASRHDDRGLIYPVVFADGRHFPKQALLRQAVNLHHVTVGRLTYQDSPEFLELHRQVQKVAQELAELLDHVPAWQANWLVFRPKDLVPQRPTLPRLEL